MKTLLKTFIGTSLLAGSMLFATPHSLDQSHTDVGFSVKHLMITKVKGNFTSFDAVIDFDHKTKTFKAFEGTVQTTSVDTGIVKRDNHLRSDDFFASERFPEMKFVMDSYSEEMMHGKLTLRGVTKDVSFKVEDLGTIKDFEGNNRVGFTLTGNINRKDYGLMWNKVIETGGVAVGEKVKITVEVEAVEK